MADIVINPSLGKIDFFTVKGDQVTNSMRLIDASTILFTGPLSASAISTGGGGAFVTSVQPTSNYLSKFTGNSTIANSLVYDNGTNVGIGTTSPIFKFQVVGSAYVNNGTLYIDSGNSLTWGNSTQSILGTNDVGLYFTAGSATRLFISSSGNIGIGTTTTAARLHVNSTTSGATVLRTDGTNGTLFSVVDDLSDSLMSVNNSAGLPVLEVFADDRIVGGQYGQNDFVVVNNKLGIGTNNPTAKLQVTSSTSTPSAAFLGGNVGVGTSSPTQLLELKKTTGSAIALLNYNDSVKFNINASSAGVGYVGMVSNHDLLFVTNDTERARVTSTGCIGIGTTSVRSNSLLTVYGSGAFGTSAYGFYVGTDATGAFLDAGTQLIRMFTGQQERIRIDANGNVGIGTTSPRVLLDLAKANNVAQVLLLGETGANIRVGFGLNPSNAGMRIFSYNHISDGLIEFGGISSDGSTWTRNHRLGLAGGNSFFNEQGGNVGIGTTSPNASLHIKPATLGANGFILERYASTAKLVYAYEYAADGYLEVRNGSDGIVSKLSGYASTPTYFQSNVGIGTTSPSATLTVITTNDTGSRIQLGTNSTSAYMNANLINDFMVLTAPYGANAASVSNGGAKWGIKMNGSIDSINIKSKSACIYAVSEENSAGYNRMVGLALHTSGFDLDNAERVRIKNDGNVGIGTTSPVSLLQVGGSSGATATPTAITFDNTYRNAVGGNTSLKIYLYKSGGETYGFGLNNAAGVEYHAGSSGGSTANHAFYTETTEKVRINSAGNVGIGTTSPDVPLYVLRGSGDSTATFKAASGGAEINLDATNGYAALKLYASGTEKWRIGQVGDSTGFQIFQGGIGNRVYINSSGNVGIGSTSPAYKFDLYDGNQDVARFYNNQTTFGLILGSTANTSYTNLLWTTSTGNAQFFKNRSSTSWGGADYFNFYTSNGGFAFHPAGVANTVYISPSGYVGISTSSPTAQLHICLDTTTYPAKNVARIVNLGYSGITGAQNWTLRGAYQYSGGIATNADGGDLDLIKSLNGNTILATKTDGTALGNVGIGTTSPSSKLDVYTNGTSNYISNRSDGADGSIQGITFVGGIYNRAIISSVNESTNGGYLTFQTYTGGNGSEKMRITGGGSVGIGTTSPSTTFHVYGNAEVGDSTADTGLIIRHGSGSSQYGRIRFYSAATNINTIHSFPTAWNGGTLLNSSAGAINLTGTNGITFGAWNSVDVAFASGGTNYFKGNVGIGISTPSAVLNIRASAPTSTGTVTTGTNVLIDSNTSNYITFRNTADNGTYAGLTFLDNNTGGYVVFRNYSGDVVAGSDSMIYGTYQDHIFQNGSSETINGKTETMRIKGNGNVGIGTNSPLSLLHVSKAGNSAGGTILMGVANDNTAKWSYLVSTQYNSSTYPQGFSLIGGVTNSTSNVIAIGGSIYEANPATEIQFYTYTSVSHNTGGSLRMVINTNGNVGIGTSSPADKLSIVNGNISLSDSYKLYNGSSNDSVGIYFSNTLQANIAGYSGIIFRSSATNISSQTERMRITNGGNVGIGTTSPSASLHVNSTTAGATVLRTDGTNGTLFSVVDDLSDSLMSVNNSAGLPVLEVFADDRIVAGQYGQNDFVVRNNRVGIGTNNPLAELHVTASTSIPAAVFIGDVGIGTTSPTAQSNYRFLQVNGPVSAIIETTVGGTRIGGFDSVSNALYVGTIGSFPIVFRTAVNEKMRIASDGNVGIGSSSPAAKLDIAGSNTTIALSFGNTVPNNPLFINTYGSNTGIGMDQATAGLRLAGDYSGGTNPLVDVGYYSGGTVAHANWVSRLKIINNGNVGIGTTSPSALLHVSGSSATSIIDGLRIGRGAGNISSNTTVGNNAFINNTTGTSNSAFGYQALYGNTTGSGSVAMGYGALYTNTTGRFNVAVGALSLYKNTFGYANTALGYQSLFNNATATANTAIGYRAMANTTGYILYNCAFGPFTLENAQGATFGADYNTAVGYNALQANTTGGSNVAVGYQALTVNKSGASNVAVGNNALGGNVTSAPSKCVAVGDSCMFNAGASPSNSTAVGTRALYSASGANNTAFGYSAGSAITTGTNLTVIGYNAAASSATATNEVTLGNSSVGTLRCAATTITSLSDFRDKTDINDIQIGLSFVEKLRPVTFKWDRREWYTDGNRDGSKKDSIIHAGFIAQELKQLQEEEGVEFLKLVYESNPDKLEATPGNLMIPLIKAVQELSIKVKFLENKIVELESK